MPTKRENEIAKIVVDAAIEVHRVLGPGLLEQAYEVALTHELQLRGLRVDCQVPIPTTYKGIHLEHGYRADMLVEGELLVEIKSIESLAPIHFKVFLTYLRLRNCRLGLILNFGEFLMKGGIKRMVNDFAEVEALV